jgi:hypothetical protein
VAQAGIGLAVPGRPIRSLVAEDRSAGGVRDQTGPESRSSSAIFADCYERAMRAVALNGHANDNPGKQYNADHCNY